MFNEGSTNNNAVVAATTGAGKSYLMNYLLKEIYSNGGLIRIFEYEFNGAILIRASGMFNVKYDFRSVGRRYVN